VPYVATYATHFVALFHVQLGTFSEILHKHDARLLDIEQAACDTHSTFTLNMLVVAGEKSDDMVRWGRPP
jgi:predicted amino acid-binding ACT domain protein